MGASGDPLAVPFALLLERFSDSSADDPLALQGKKLQLSHAAPVEVSQADVDPSQDVGLLSPQQIKSAYDLFSHCLSADSFSISHAEAERVLGTQLDQEFWSRKLSRALEETATAQSSINLIGFFKKLAGSSMRHFRIYQGWLKELDHVASLKGELAESRKLLKQFEGYISLPILPAAARKELLQEYDSLNTGEMATSAFMKSRLAHAGRMSARGAISEFNSPLLLYRWIQFSNKRGGRL